ncbi:right-handed parallel beta-helix repeat-containing protein [Listeria weihenstephanensis]|uniref:Right-handed parallel beta-helix repeat-containing protein n=1 Tax=Listeria weihenstephanensis TaxID=1006155 RepID=A0A841Z3A1_9LIST|nr:right-handed parallel beta-helix repeat-containing protein [Listeria weihenstephanensis]MBC1499705.1 right-handed parallel beta-helix repeat-containing protein [Listeria weihenstephanensis]
MKITKLLKVGAVCSMLVLGFLVLSMTGNKVLATDTSSVLTKGALPLGSTNYAIPADAVFVSPSGSSGGTGTITNPVDTVARAQKIIQTEGRTIVLRAGTYHESLTKDTGAPMWDTGLTIQSYPGEEVWFDGSSAVTGWKKEGTAWVHDNWTIKFDASPTFTKGAPDFTAENWKNINPSYPMAAHPDQIWMNGKAMQQVESFNKLGLNKFYMDYATNKIYLGDDPTNKEVRASDLQIALSMDVPKITVRGVGIRRYAPSVPDLGAVRISEPATGSKLENVIITDSATSGLQISTADVTLQNVTVINSGLLGIGTNRAHNLKADKLYVANSNLENFNMSPIASGIKLSRSYSTVISNSKIVDNKSVGLWFDEDCYDATVVNNEISNNMSTGIAFELSSLAKIANNRINNNAGYGLHIFNSDQMEVWNNTLTGSPMSILIQQDSRKSEKDRYWAPHVYSKDISWYVNNIKISNNILGLPTKMASPWGGVVALRDETYQRTGNQMGVSLNGNVYYRTGLEGATTLVQWSTKTAGIKDWNSFTNLAAFRKATGQDSRSIEMTENSTPLNTNGFARYDIQQQASAVASPIKHAIAIASDLPSGEKFLGPTPNLLGNLDRVDAKQIIGWAWNPDEPTSISTNLKINIYDEQHVVVDTITTEANQYRADIQKAGFGSGYGGFAYTIDWNKYPKNKKYRVVVFAADDAGVYNPLPNVRYYAN